MRSASLLFQYNNQDKSLADYVWRRYNQKIKDLKQPLLISHPTNRDRRRGFTHNIALIPELCYFTGLSDDDRKNFRLMKEFKEKTKMDPLKRVRALEMFANRLANTGAAQTELESWGLRLEQSLVQITARLFKPENIVTGGRTYDYQSANAEWGKTLK